MPVTIDLTAKRREAETIACRIGNADFEAVENTLVKGGDLQVTVTVTSDPVGLNIAFDIAGTAIVECDRCLDDMEVAVNCQENLKVQFSDHYEDADDIIYVEDKQTDLDLWPFIYDYIVLALPLTHAHAEGQCNPDMMDTLNRYMVTKATDEDE